MRWCNGAMVQHLAYQPGLCTCNYFFCTLIPCLCSRNVTRVCRPIECETVACLLCLCLCFVLVCSSVFKNLFVFVCKYIVQKTYHFYYLFYPDTDINKYGPCPGSCCLSGKTTNSATHSSKRKTNPTTDGRGKHKGTGNKCSIRSHFTSFLR